MNLKLILAAMKWGIAPLAFGADGSANSGFTGCLSKAGLGIGSTATEISVAAPNGAGFDFCVHGVAYHYADDASVASVPAALAQQAADTTCLYLVQITGAGVVSMKKGTEVLNTDLAAGNAVLHWPTPDADNCPVGAVKVKTVAATFTAGTTAFDASGITDTYYDFGMGMPNKPLTS